MKTFYEPARYLMSQESFMAQDASDVDFTYVALAVIEVRAFEH